MLKSIAQVKTFVNEVVNAESTAHILSNRGRIICKIQINDILPQIPLYIRYRIFVYSFLYVLA